MPGTRRKLSSVGAMAALLLVAGACSSSGGNHAASGTTAANQSTHTAASATPVKVGLVCSCTGTELAGTVAAGAEVAQAWAKSVNASGGIGGHPVDLTLKDDHSAPGNSLIAAQSLIAAHVDAILDLTTYDSTWASAASAANIPVIDGDSVSPMFYQDPDFYSSGQTLDALVESNMVTAKLAGASNLAEFYCAESPSCGGQALLANVAASKRVGVPIIYTASVAATAPNYTAQCLAAEQAGVKGLFIADSAAVFIRVAEDCAQQGFHPIYVESGLGYTTQVATTPELANNLWAPFTVIPFFADISGVQHMDSVVDQYYPGLRSNPNSWSEGAVQSWTGTLLLAKAVAASGVAATATITAADVVRGLNSLTNETLGGMTPPLTFTAGKPHPVDCWFVGRVENGKPVVADNGKLSCSQTS
jgi:branched-chain amino acid transport system substrate-binding protein